VLRIGLSSTKIRYRFQKARGETLSLLDFLLFFLLIFIILRYLEAEIFMTNDRFESGNEKPEATRLPIPALFKENISCTLLGCLGNTINVKTSTCLLVSVLKVCSTAGYDVSDLEMNLLRLQEAQGVR
jgi:hypothetical protein